MTEDERRMDRLGFTFGFHVSELFRFADPAAVEDCVRKLAQANAMSQRLPGPDDVDSYRVRVEHEVAERGEDGVQHRVRRVVDNWREPLVSEVVIVWVTLRWQADVERYRQELDSAERMARRITLEAPRG